MKSFLGHGLHAVAQYPLYDLGRIVIVCMYVTNSLYKHTHTYVYMHAYNYAYT